MFKACLHAFCISTLFFLAGSSQVAMGDERTERIENGEKFLTASRIDDWEELFKLGVRKMGRIVATNDGKVTTEALFEDQYKLARIFEGENRVFTTIANPDYFASVRTRNGQSRISGVYPPVGAGWVFVNVLPFMIGSSVNFTNALIAENLKTGVLRIHDYRSDGNKHIVELEYTDNPDNGLIELIFDDDISPLLPVETVFGKGTQYARHFISSDFREVAGYMVPHKVEEMNAKHDQNVVTIKFLPNDRLDPAMCRLTYYGLPEPGELTVSDFGRKQTQWLTISMIALGVAGVSITGYVLTRRRTT